MDGCRPVNSHVNQFQLSQSDLFNALIRHFPDALSGLFLAVCFRHGYFCPQTDIHCRLVRGVLFIAHVIHSVCILSGPLCVLVCVCERKLCVFETLIYFHPISSSSVYCFNPLGLFVFCWSKMIFPTFSSSLALRFVAV